MFTTTLLIAMSAAGGHKGCYSCHAEVVDYKPHKVVSDACHHGGYSCKRDHDCNGCRGGLFRRIFCRRGRDCNDCDGCKAACHVVRYNGCYHDCHRRGKRCRRYDCGDCRVECAHGTSSAKVKGELKPVPKLAPKPEAPAPKTGSLDQPSLEAVAFSSEAVTYVSTPIVVYARR